MSDLDLMYLPFGSLGLFMKERKNKNKKTTIWFLGIFMKVNKNKNKNYHWVWGSLQ
jgi:hypothetical protein